MSIAEHLALAVERAVEYLEHGREAEALTVLSRARATVRLGRRIAVPCWLCDGVAELGRRCKVCDAQQPPF